MIRIVDPELEKQTLTPHESVKDDFKKLSDLDCDINDENEKKGRLKSTKVSYVGKYTLLEYLESELINTKNPRNVRLNI